ncbi:RHS repeat-associated protein [Actinophytocola oryzae]|uniref:RHS repeat-associated protein n=1 Tax=Actinophytocola oryzae TaxID=502181 RepID=A0A4R7W253_9PSEU|nr:RHS repeat-associated protein [Actinophytocola oryzae]
MRRRRVAMVLSSVLAVSAVVGLPGRASAAGGPSVPLPDTAPTPVTEQTMKPRDADEATVKELHGNQESSGQADGGGTNKATPLAPSAKWDVSRQTGDFTWSYPLRVPPSPGGFVPDLALSYASSTVDGRTSATNNQASWVGDGWDLSVGYIERSYLPCALDTMDGTTPPTVGDLCWRSDNATASYDGKGGELVRNDADGTWRVAFDDGSRVERTGNPGEAGESWKITTVDGTQYFFGSRDDAHSKWTVPVFGDDANDPCHKTSGFTDSHCVMPWRWNLDKVVDRNGNMILYDYEVETNSYGMNRKDPAVSYVRSGTLSSAEYGLNTANDKHATGRVDFAVAPRCVPGSDCTPDKKANWPDVSWDDKCDTATCPDRYSPTFWSTKRLDAVTTSVWNGSKYTPVEKWTMDQQFPKSGDGEKPALWLKGIRHSGLAGTQVDLPDVRFEGKSMENRVVKQDGIGPLLRYRITAVVSEAGGVITVNYAPPDCLTAPAHPESNTLRCYPVKWAKKDFAEQTDYFHKYVVESITESDRLATNTEQETRYQYLDGAAWAYDDSEFTKDDHRDWNVFHGFRRVRITKGKPGDLAGPQTMVEERYYQGMDGDRQPNNGTRSASVPDTEGTDYTDSPWLRGFQYESVVHDGTSDRVVSKTIVTPSVQGPVATRGSIKAYLVRPAVQTNYTALAAGGWRKSRTEQSFDTSGLVTTNNDLGDLATGDDDKCTTTLYKRNVGKWLIDMPWLVKTSAAACTATPTFPEDAVSATRTCYDGGDCAAGPTRGNVTRTEELDSWNGSDPVTTLVSTAVYDDYGRVTSTKDAKDHETTTAYTPDKGGPVTESVVTDPAGFTTKTTLDPAYGQPLKVVDANGFTTETAYDALGRVTEIWLPDRPRSPDVRGNQYFSYAYHNDAPTTVTSSAIGPKGNYTTSTQLFDGLLRPRQKQVPAPGGGRLIVDTRYDSQGRAYRTTKPYFTNSPVDDRIWIAGDVETASQTLTTFDGAGRPTVETVKTGADDAWQTTTVYGGDRVTVTPPAGGTVTMTLTDARGQTTELRQYPGATAQGDDYDSTKYAYTPAGQLARLTDPAGQVWQHTYDLHGREVVTDDPDKGTSTSSYDELGQLVSTTDARNTTLVYDYDSLGRRRAEHLGTATGPVQAEWTYDTVEAGGKGLLATSSRYVDGLTYRSEVLAYDQRGRPVGTTVTIPASREEPALAGTYTTYQSYKEDGSVGGVTLPEIGSLPTETLTYTYDDLGGLQTASGGYDGETVDYVTATDYTRYGEQARIRMGAPGRQVWVSNYYDTNLRRHNRSIVDIEAANPKQSDVNYSYDLFGNVTSIADASDTQCFRYDYVQRLAEAWTPGAGCAADPAVSALSGVAPYWQSFTYDKSGNRLTQTQHAAAGDTVQTSTYPAAGQPDAHKLASVSTVGPGVNTSGAVTYDETGNVRTKPGQVLDWDAEGHLAKVTEGGRTTEFRYDAAGNRLLRRDATGSTLYLGGQELRVTRATGAKSATRYYAYGDQTVAMRDSSGLTWLAADDQGTAQTAINSTTMKVTRRRQTPFGGSRGPAVTFPGEKGFVGGTNDPTGLVHLGAREYDPVLGRFLSVDPQLSLGDPQMMNGYTYADDSPVTKSDPSGNAPICNKFGDCMQGHDTGASNPAVWPAERAAQQENARKYADYIRERTKPRPKLDRYDGDNLLVGKHGPSWAEEEAKFMANLDAAIQASHDGAWAPDGFSVSLCVDAGFAVIFGGSLCMVVDGQGIAFQPEYGTALPGLSTGYYTELVPMARKMVVDASALKPARPGFSLKINNTPAQPGPGEGVTVTHPLWGRTLGMKWGFESDFSGLNSVGIAVPGGELSATYEGNYTTPYLVRWDHVFSWYDPKEHDRFGFFK